MFNIPRRSTLALGFSLAATAVTAAAAVTAVILSGTLSGANTVDIANFNTTASGIGLPVLPPPIPRTRR